MKSTYELCIRLSPTEKALLVQNAKLVGLSKTAYIRKLIVGTTPRARPTAELQALRTEIHKIGNNINQIARSVNAGIATKEDAHAGLYLLEKVYDRLGEIVDD